jgi:preprotein translocase subunit SecA
MRLFGSDRIAKLMDRMGAQEGEVLTHPLITRSIEQAQKRVELQNFQARKRLLEYDDVMNQQREVIYNLRTFALEGGEELKGEALKMVERAVGRRVEQVASVFDTPDEWDWALVQQELLLHYMLQVPEFAEDAEHPAAEIGAARDVAVQAGVAAYDAKVAELRSFEEQYRGVLNFSADQVLSHVMLGVLDEKWKDHLYDLDQLRSAIHYRGWGQKDPLLEYKQEAFTMFEDLVGDIANTFTERFLRVQLVVEGPPAGDFAAPAGGDAGSRPAAQDGGRRPTRRYNAFGILEDIPPEELAAGAANGDGDRRDGDGRDGDVPAAAGGAEEILEVGPGEPPGDDVAVREEASAPAPAPRPRQGTPVLTGVKAPKPLHVPGKSAGGASDWSSVGRNDPCPCGSGKKFKKCHGQMA